jgi:hypothetical protein
MKRLFGFAGLALAVALGTGATCTPQQGAADVTIGLEAAICVINTVETDLQGGHSQVEAIADAAFKCGVSAAQASGVFSAHVHGMTMQGCTPKP